MKNSVAIIIIFLCKRSAVIEIDVHKTGIDWRIMHHSNQPRKNEETDSPQLLARPAIGDVIVYKELQPDSGTVGSFIAIGLVYKGVGPDKFKPFF